MRRLLNKEIRLASAPITWIFLAFSLMTMIPGYPILMGGFFVCFGIFQSFQYARESNDVLYTVLLPVRKRDFVAAKYTFSCLIQGIGFLLMTLLTVLRMTVLSGAEVYQSNALMNATPLFLGFVLLIYTAFNVLFIGGFFRTAYKFGMPFLRFGIATFFLVGIAEMLHYLPGLGFFNTPSGERLGLQFGLLGAAAAVYAGLTLLSCRRSSLRFEQIDL